MIWGSSSCAVPARAATDGSAPAQQPSCELCGLEASSAEVLGQPSTMEHQEHEAEQLQQDRAGAADDRCSHAELCILPPGLTVQDPSYACQLCMQREVILQGVG